MILSFFKDARSGGKNNFQCLSIAAAVVSADSLPSVRVLWCCNSCSCNSFFGADELWCFFLDNPGYDLISEGICSGQRGI